MAHTDNWYLHGLETFRQYCFKYNGPAEAADILTRYCDMQANDPDPTELEYCRGIRDAIQSANLA